mmetsp:Transcript_69139/g.123098  ORF Transcript_69139/g.123098 Transcript_69139/m.123098 type:complete len:220 (+) Transcript_69139:77-736(+)
MTHGSALIGAILAALLSPHSSEAKVTYNLYASQQAAVSSKQWRFIGRGADRWLVNRVRFFGDSACSPRTEISSLPWRGRAGGERYDGSAFAGPHLVRPPGGDPADAFQANNVAWDSGVPCGLYSDRCLIGFRWLRDQLGVGEHRVFSKPSFATVKVVDSASVTPLCIEFTQPKSTGSYATTLLVQYWKESSRAWLNHTVLTGLTGGTKEIRLPLVPLST